MVGPDLNRRGAVASPAFVAVSGGVKRFALGEGGGAETSVQERSLGLRVVMVDGGRRDVGPRWRILLATTFNAL